MSHDVATPSGRGCQPLPVLLEEGMVVANVGRIAWLLESAKADERMLG